MEVVEFDDPAEFRRFVDPLLLTAEAENCLLLGITGTLIDRPEIYERYHLWAVSEDGTPRGAAAMTPPHNLILSDTNGDAWLGQLAKAIANKDVDLPGVQGNTPTVDGFCSIWRSIRTVEVELEVELGVHAVTEVSNVAEVEGRARRAGPDDKELLVDWIGAFLEEADPQSPRTSLATTVQSRLEAEPSLGGLWLWDVDTEPVALSGYGGRTPGGVRIGPVYTPPNHRRHGYATALVAEQTRWLLEQGRRFCFLFTDMSNPISNSIYAKIGYVKVADARRYGFRSRLGE